MKDDDRKRIEEIMAGMQCPKDFKCAENGFETLCRSEDRGVDNYLDCLEDDPDACAFSLSFGFGHYCQCPLRVFLAKNLKI